jgi:predicted transcriptional regulator
MKTPGQIKAARAFLGWSQDDLAEKSGVSAPTVKRIETGGLESAAFGSVRAIQDAFEKAGIQFTPDGGVNPPAEKR